MNPQDWQGIHSPLAEVVREMSARNVDAILAQNDLLREQANIEQTVVEGGYNTKQVNELIQNASDAMDGLEGRLEVILTDDHLYCANEGMPFQEPGIRAIMMSHSSSKDSDDIGRFGLGFKSVLVLCDTPEIFSRSASFRWDQKYLRKRLNGHSVLEELDALPTLRVAEPLDPLDAARHDPILASLMGWASTVVRLPLKHTVPWLGSEVVNFPGTFLLFSDKIGSLVLDDRRAGTCVEWKARRDTDQHVVLSRNDVEEAWNVFALEHKPSTIARAEAGRLAAREEMTVKWAVPRFGAVKRGELWTHFPTTSTTTLSGIVNAPFKMNEDRHNLLECRYNEEILTRTLPRIVSGALATIVDARTPARVLSILPARGRESQSWADKILNDAVWQAVAAVPCLPDAHGELHAAHHILVPDLNASQDDDDRELAELWYRTAARFDIRGWIDLACITNRELNSKVERVLELQKSPRRPVREWIQALVNPLDLDSLEAALGIVQKIQRSYSKFQEAAQQAYMVRDAAGEMRRPITTELSLPADLSEAADGNTQIIDPGLVRHGNCHAILIDLGFKVMDAHGRLHRQLTLVKRDPSNPQLMASAWTISRGADKPGRVAQILAEHLKAEDILVRCQDQEWRPLGQVWLKGQLFPMNHSRDADLLVDSAYHAQDLQVLRFLGARMDLPQDQIRTKSRSEPLYAMWADAVSVELTEQLRKDEVPVMPQNVRLGEVYLTPGVEQLCGASPEIRTRVALRLMRHKLYPTTPSLSGMYQENLPDIVQPDLWWIQQFGCLDTYYGLTPVSQCVGGVLGYPEDELPRPKDPAVAAFLNLPSRPEDIDWPTTLDIAARALPVRKLHDLYGRVAMQGVTRPDQLIVRSGGSRRPVVAEVCVVTTSDRTAQHLEATDDKTYVVQVESEAQAVALADNWSLRRVDIAFSTSVDCSAAQELTSVVKTLPHVRDVTSKIPSTLKVQWCSRLSLVEGNDHDHHRIETPVPEHLDRSHRILYIRGAANRLNLWNALRRTYGLAETAQELELTHRRIEKEHLHGSMSEAERWVDILGQEAFERILPGTLIDMVESVSERRITAEELFQLARNVHGMDLLTELKAYFAEQTGSARIPEKSAVWHQFQGMVGAATRRPSITRPPAREEIMGPVKLKELHRYQQTVVDKIGRVLDGSSEQRRGLLMLPTGAGKTRAMTEALVRHIASPENPGTHLIVWFAHTKELCEQAIDSWKAVWQAVGAEGERMAVSRFYEGNREQTEPEKVRLHLVVSTPQTMIRIVDNTDRRQDYKWLFGADVVVADEAHGSISPTYTEIFKAFGRDHRSRDKVTLGMTATPYRGQDEEGTRRLVNRYDGNLIQPDEFDTPTAHTYLQELGVLSRVRHEVLEGMTLLRKAPGKDRPSEDEEFDDDDATRMAELYLDLEAVAGNIERNQILLQHLLARGRNGLSIVFAATVAHAEALAAALEHMDIPAAAISGATSAPLRRAAVEDFRAGRIKVLTNYNVLSEGFDAPGVDAVYVARPTFSPNRYLQMIGRGLRGPKNGGSPWTTVINVQDNVSAFGTRLAFDHFEHLWTPALV